MDWESDLNPPSAAGEVCCGLMYVKHCSSHLHLLKERVSLTGSQGPSAFSILLIYDILCLIIRKSGQLEKTAVFQVPHGVPVTLPLPLWCGGGVCLWVYMYLFTFSSCHGALSTSHSSISCCSVIFPKGDTAMSNSTTKIPVLTWKILPPSQWGSLGSPGLLSLKFGFREAS